ncbi:MAG: S8 family serine peptidase [Patescibacteria group bacterium]|nr:S8 family serine peptidase [Patescibacteria group bacterium]
MNFNINSRLRRLYFFGLSLMILSSFVAPVALAVIPNDPLFANQWYLKRIRANWAWDEYRESPDVIIAVIDSGVDINHPDLAENVWKNTKEIPNNKIDDDKNGYIDDVNGWDFVNNVFDPMPKFKKGFDENAVGHGTLVAGIIAAQGNNNIGITGVTWKGKIMALKAIDDRGDGDSKNIVKAVNYAVDNGANVINVSFVGAGYNKDLEKAIQRAYDAGVIVVAAGGNEGHGQDLDKKPMYPVCLGDKNKNNIVIGVAATGPQDEKADFSGFGSKCIDIAAPGISIMGATIFSEKYGVSGQRFDKYFDGYWSGTSLAAPMVSGAIALIEQANPGLKPKEVIDVLLSSTEEINSKNPGYEGKLGIGRLDVEEAVLKAKMRKNILRFNVAVANYPEPGIVKIINQDGTFGKEFSTGNSLINLAVGDVNKDGSSELIVAPMGAGRPEVKIYNADGKLLKKLLVFSPNWRYGVNLAAGDLNDDDKAEIAVAGGAGANSEIKIFSFEGKLLKKIVAFPTPFNKGVNISIGDIDSNGTLELAAIPASNANAQVRIFNFSGKVLTQFMTYDKNTKGGFNVEVPNVYSSIKRSGQIIVSPLDGIDSYVKIFDNRGRLVRRFAALSQNYNGGINFSSGDLDYDGEPELVISGGKNIPYISIYEASGLMRKTLSLGKSKSKYSIKTAIMYFK